MRTCIIGGSCFSLCCKRVPRLDLKYFVRSALFFPGGGSRMRLWGCRLIEEVWAIILMCVRVIICVRKNQGGGHDFEIAC